MDPIHQNTTQAAQPTNTVAKIQTAVNFTTVYIGIGDSSGLLEWTYDDRIRLFELDRNDPSKSTLVFDIVPADIKKVKGLSPSLSFHLHNGKNYYFMFSDKALLALGAIGGFVGGVASDVISNKAGIGPWRAQLEQFGVMDKSTSMTKLMGKGALWTLVGVGILFVITVIAFLISES
jgi:hypothetical protein